MKKSILLLAFSLTWAVSYAWLPSSTEGDPAAGITLKPGVYAAKWVIPPANRGDVTNVAAGKAELLTTPQTSLKGKPAFKSRHPLFGTIRFNGSTTDDTRDMLMALDESRGTGKGYDTLYLDANRNRDLSDDPRRIGKRAKDDPFHGGDIVAFISAARMPYKKLVPGAQSGNPVLLDLYVRPPLFKKQPYTAELRLRGCWEGTVDSSKGRIPFRLQDWNMNGRFGDSWRGPTGEPRMGDLVRFDWRRTGDFGNHFSYYNTYFLASSPASVNSRLFMLKPDSEGNKLEVSPYTGPAGRLALRLGKVGKVNLIPVYPVEEVRGDAGVYRLPSNGRPLEVPVGSYMLSKASAQSGDEKSRHWTLRYTPFKPFTVDQAKMTLVTIEGKLLLQIAPGQKTAVVTRGQRANVVVTTLLPGGQAIIRNKEEYVLPVVKWMDASGKVVHKGMVNADPIWLRDLEVVPATLKPGTYTLEAMVDAGPFGGKLRAIKPVVVK